MEFITRIFVEIIFEVIAYNTGYYMWLILPTKIQIEPLVKQKNRKGREFFSFTYTKGTTKFLFHDSIALFGLMVWFTLGIFTYIIFRINF